MPVTTPQSTVPAFGIVLPEGLFLVGLSSLWKYLSLTKAGVPCLSKARRTPNQDISGPVNENAERELPWPDGL